jgi:hypothetical protein
VVCYLALIEIGKYWFYRLTRTPGRRAARFATHHLLRPPARTPARRTPAKRPPVNSGSEVPAG